MKRTKKVYGIKVTKANAIKFNLFQRNFSHILPAMNTIECHERKSIVIEYVKGIANNMSDAILAQEISRKYNKEIN